MAERIPCPMCGAEFRPRIRRKGQPQRFCSLPCRDASYRSREPLPASVDCGVCGQAFAPRRGKGNEAQKFCSLACRNLSYRRDPHVATCQQCGVEFVDRWHAASRPRRFCSMPCHAASQALPLKRCEVCDGEFRATGTRAQTGRFCSRECQATLTVWVTKCCETCDVEMTFRESTPKRFCSMSCAAFGKPINGKPSVIATAGIDEWCARRDRPIHTREHRVGRWSIDLALPLEMIAVELDGVYWHSLPAMVDRDRRKDAALADAGWDVRRVVIGGQDTPAVVADGIDKVLRRRR